MPAADSSLGAHAPSVHPLVAIATPVYNGAAYLAEAMASVQAQTYPNLVHVVVDNASTDETPVILERFKGGRVPVVVARNPETIPVGPNWCAAAAQVPQEAKYFFILCADDVLAVPHAIERMVAVAESDPDVELVGSVSRRNSVVLASSLPPGQSVFDGKYIASRFLNKISDDLPHMYGLYRRHQKDFEKDFFDYSMHGYDSDACLRAVARGKFGYVHEPLVMIRLHPEQMTEKLAEVSFTVFEPLLLIERYAKQVMNPAEATRCRQRHLRVIYRFLLYWRATGRGQLATRELRRLADHGAAPRLSDYRDAVLEWPLREIRKRLQRRKTVMATEALGFGPASFSPDVALPRVLDVRAPKP
jgi:glycosyltransferase involved in cell wall biosynthesis